MSIKVHCVSCRYLILQAEELEGVTLRCPFCNTVNKAYGVRVGEGGRMTVVCGINANLDPAECGMQLVQHITKGW